MVQHELKMYLPFRGRTMQCRNVLSLLHRPAFQMGVLFRRSVRSIRREIPGPVWLRRECVTSFLEGICKVSLYF